MHNLSLEKVRLQFDCGFQSSAAFIHDFTVSKQKFKFKMPLQLSFEVLGGKLLGCWLCKLHSSRKIESFKTMIRK